MQTWKNKLVVSQLALACTLAIASQANAKDSSVALPGLHQCQQARKVG